MARDPWKYETFVQVTFPCTVQHNIAHMRVFLCFKPSPELLGSWYVTFKFTVSSEEHFKSHQSQRADTQMVTMVTASR